MIMFKPGLPGVKALESNDDHQHSAEVRLARLRTEVAVVRTLADQIELLVRPRHAEGVRDQLVEELARLGCLLFETAAELTNPPTAEDSGIFPRRSVMRVT
jgi:hypothetical protein